MLYIYIILLFTGTFTFSEFLLAVSQINIFSNNFITISAFH